LSPAIQRHTRTSTLSRGPNTGATGALGVATATGAATAVRTGSGEGGGAGVLGMIVVTAGCGGGGTFSSSAVAIASRSILGSTAMWWLVIEFSGSCASSSRTRRIS
jgi:hypothetical protein